MKRLGVLLLLLDGMLVHPSISSGFPDSLLIPIYSWVERGTVRVKCLAQEHNTITWPGLEPGPLEPESSAAGKEAGYEQERMILFKNKSVSSSFLRVLSCVSLVKVCYSRSANRYNCAILFLMPVVWMNNLVLWLLLSRDFMIFLQDAIG